MVLNKLLEESMDQVDLEEEVNTLFTQIQSTLDSIKFDVNARQVTTYGKVGLLKSLITNIIVRILQLEYLPMEAFAQQVHLKPDTVRRKLKAGELLGVMLREKWYVKRSELWHFPEYLEDPQSEE
ncbi:MAG: hypothetical protein ACYC0N_02690 [Carboxydocellales bacterium]